MFLRKGNLKLLLVHCCTPLRRLPSTVYAPSETIFSCKWESGILTGSNDCPLGCSNWQFSRLKTRTRGPLKVHVSHATIYSWIKWVGFPLSATQNNSLTLENCKEHICEFTILSSIVCLVLKWTLNSFLSSVTGNIYGHLIKTCWTQGNANIECINFKNAIRFLHIFKT